MTEMTKLTGLMNRFQSLNSIQQRAVAAVVGASVADAATRPLHWLYDRNKLESIIGENDPAFWPDNLSPFYSIPTGRRSCYNDMSYCLLRSLPKNNRESPVLKDYVESLKDFFSPSSEYAEALSQRPVYDPAKRLEDRQPVSGPWQQGAVTYFLKNSATETPIGDPNNKETDGLCSVIPLIAKLSADPQKKDDSTFFEEITKFASVLSSNSYAMDRVLVSSDILRHSILQGPEGLKWKEIEAMVAHRHQISNDNELQVELNHIKESLLNSDSYAVNVEKFGKACGYPGSFIGSLLALSIANQEELSFADTIRQVMKVGGCNCSRANFVGACLGAVYGIQGMEKSTNSKGIPVQWILQTDKCLEIFDLALERVTGC